MVFKDISLALVLNLISQHQIHPLPLIISLLYSLHFTKVSFLLIYFLLLNFLNFYVPTLITSILKLFLYLFTLISLQLFAIYPPLVHLIRFSLYYYFQFTFQIFAHSICLHLFIHFNFLSYHLFLKGLLIIHLLLNLKSLKHFSLIVIPFPHFLYRFNQIRLLLLICAHNNHYNLTFKLKHFLAHGFLLLNLLL